MFGGSSLEAVSSIFHQTFWNAIAGSWMALTNVPASVLSSTNGFSPRSPDPCACLPRVGPWTRLSEVLQHWDPIECQQGFCQRQTLLMISTSSSTHASWSSGGQRIGGIERPCANAFSTSLPVLFYGPGWFCKSLRQHGAKKRWRECLMRFLPGCSSSMRAWRNCLKWTSERCFLRSPFSPGLLWPPVP